MKMKKEISLIVAISTFIIFLNTSCGQQEQIDRLQYQVDSLQQAKNESDRNLRIISETMVDIENTVSSIKEKRGVITLTKSESGKKSIKEDLEALDKRLQEDKNKLQRLQKLLNESNNKNQELIAMIETLQAQVDQQTAEIARLNEQLSQQNATIARQSKQISTLEDDLSTSQSQAAQASQLAQETKAKLDATTEEMNRVYFAIGTRSELKKKGILQGVSTINISRGNGSVFEKADKTTFTRIDLGGKFKKLLSNQPESAYKIESGDDGDVLVITDKDAFWQRSSYLVIRIK